MDGGLNFDSQPIHINSYELETGKNCLKIVGMSQFVADLWESVFTPGVSPTLLKATYGAFVLLVSVLGVLLFFTRNVHVLALLIVSFCLIGSLVW